MKIFLGTDICEIDRIKKVHLKFKDKFLNKVFTEKEIKYCESQGQRIYQSLAARYSAKEAVSKALSVGINGLGWADGIYFKDVEIIRAPNGSISLNLTNQALIEQQKLKINHWTISVSHSSNNAIATVIGHS